MKLNCTTYLFLILLLFASSKPLLAQCPSVITTQQSFCDLQSPTVANLTAVDNGGGILWYNSATATNPLPASAPLASGTTYYAGDSNNLCEERQSVTVTIYGTPSGLNFQGVCVENIADATLTDLIVIGNNIKWYTTPVGGTPLPPNSQIINNTVYFASQTNPNTGCETSRLAVFVNVRVVTAPTGESVQNFCYDPLTETVNVSDLVVDVPIANWYLEEDAIVPLAENIPLIDGHTYYATTVSFPCESIGRLPVTVHLFEENKAGSSSNQTYCHPDLTPDNSVVDLFTFLGGNPHQTGYWQGDIAISNGYLGTINLSSLALDTPYIFTYTVDTTAECEPDQAQVQIEVKSFLHAGYSNQLEVCITDTNTYDLFELLGTNAQEGGFWTPQLASGTSIFNPQVDAIGAYTYSFANSCSDAATIVIYNTPILSAGQDNTFEVCPTDLNTYDLFTLLGGSPDSGGFWTPQLASGTSIFNPQLDEAVVYTYSFQDNCNLDSATITITHTPLLNAGVNNSLHICQNDTNTYDLFPLLGDQANSGGIWTPQLASGSSIFNPQIDLAGTYVYSFNDNCNTDTATVVVNIIPYYDAGENSSVEICPNGTNTYDLITLLGGNPDQGGVWTPQLASGTSIFNPQIDVAGIYTYSFEECPSSASVSITFTTILNAGQNNTLQICPQDTTFYNLFELLGENADLGGIWTPQLASGTGIFNPQVDPIGQYTYSFSDGCTTDVSTVTITHLPIFNAGENNTLEICPNDTTTYNLFSLLGGNPDQGGIWTPQLASGTNIFNPQLDAVGVYTYSFDNDCSGSSTITINYTPDSYAGEDTVLEICYSDTTTYDLFTLLGGNPDQGGIWFPQLASGTSIYNPQVDNAGVYTYLFENECSDSATVTISVIAELHAGENNILEICENNSNSHDLFPLLGPNANQGGIWTPALASGTSIFNPEIDNFGVYTYSFEDSCNTSSASITITQISNLYAGEDNVIELCPTDTNFYDLLTFLGGFADEGGVWTPPLTSGGGIFNLQLDSTGVYTYTHTDTCADSATITISLLSVSNPGEDTILEICENDTNTYDLFSLLGGNPDQGGVWTPSLASGTNIFNPQVDALGTYTYSFPDNCDGASASITITSVPSFNAGEDNSLQLCPNDTNTYDLFDLLGANADQGGIWTPPLASGTTIYNPLVDTATTYTYSFNDACADSATITITIVPTLSAGDNNSLQVCQNDTSTHDLFSLLGTNANLGGVWSPQLASGTNIFNPQVDPTGVYTYSFTDGCNTDTATIIITYIPSLTAGEDNELGLCPTETNTYDLFALLGGNPDTGGVWSPQLASGTNIFDPIIDGFGIYTYSFTDACADSATITVFPLPELSAGENSILEICQTETATYDLLSILGGNPNAGGVWTPQLASGTGIFDPQIDLAGVYTYSFDDNCNTDSATITISYLPSYNAGESNVIEICPDDTNSYDLFTYLGENADQGGIWNPPLVSGGGIFNPQLDSVGVYTYAFAEACSGVATITIVLLPELSAGEDSTLEICPNDTNTYDLFALLGGNPDTGGIWTPPLASGTSIFDPQVDEIGFYSYAFANPCSNTATVVVSLLPSFNAGEDNTLEICSNDTNTYDLFTLLGENAEIGGIWTPELASGTGIFDPQLDVVGSYTYSFADTCSSSATISISEVPELNPGEDSTLEICENDTNTYDLFSLLGGNPDQGGIWTPALASGSNIFNPQLDVAQSYMYSFDDDCNFSYSSITIERELCETPVDELLIPDGFSPNGDGINDTFEIRNIRTLYPNFKIEIYNRYGNILFTGGRNSNDWDGTTQKGIKLSDGKAPAGVYFYILYFNDGQRSSKQGRLYLSR